MTNIEVFAFVVLPAIIVVVGYVAVRVFEHVHPPANARRIDPSVTSKNP